MPLLQIAPVFEGTGLESFSVLDYRGTLPELSQSLVMERLSSLLSSTCKYSSCGTVDVSHKLDLSIFLLDIVLVNTESQSTEHMSVQRNVFSIARRYLA